MIAVLGIRRVALLVGLVALNALLAATIYLYFEPQSNKVERDLRAVKGEVSTLQSDINRMEVEFTQLEDQKAAFQVLEDDGFFKNQSRRQAETIFNEIQKRSGVNSAVATIDAGVIEENEEAKKAGYMVLKSPVHITISALDDVSIYHYIFLIENYFPGHASIEEINMTRKADVSGTILRSIASGANVPLVGAEIDLLWRTMIPEGEVIDQEAQR